MNNMSSIAVAKIIPISVAIERHGFKFSRILNDIGMAPDIMDSPGNQISDLQLADIIGNAVFFNQRPILWIACRRGIHRPVQHIGSSFAEP
ncbi:hypothetical protein [Dethiosulfatarculus sandiegensis]|uniref:hypothetical protein n=1 Tax=Dethiosulfatarculus sandiegensis TaxID=1429043 RepID=UPI0012E16821|nr:hypothetical protein [Dethiosulfatarculus sandiegensis]